MEYDKNRKIRSTAKKTALEHGAERQAAPQRKCPVEGCKHVPQYFSRYCRYHADKLRRNGHPVLMLQTKSLDQYAQALKVGRWLREALTKDDVDRRAWMRVEDALARMGRDHALKHGIPVLSRREKAWRNEFKARCVISTRLEKIDPEEMLAAFLGLASVVIEANEVLVNAKQMELFINKAGAKAVVRYMKAYATDPETERIYTWSPSAGCVTWVGKLISREIAKEHGARWWKEAEVSLKTRNQAA